ncbi:MAG: hypothetical protein JWR80_8406 [Bradyrhizobium sp.]|nr:hypothetical protein [Bradyrhizobium sp.]
MQTGNGTVTTQVGDATERAGSDISVGGRLHESSLAVASNSVTGTSIGNNVTNALGETAGSSASQAGAASAGPIDTSYGAAGSLALVSNQKIGQTTVDNTLTPTISSSVYGMFSATAGNPIERSSLTVDGNTQRANALANVAVNRLSESGSLSGEAPSLALSSSQYGEAHVAALSDAEFAASEALFGSSASISGNGNVALAVVNDADNAVSTTGANTSEDGSAALTSGLAGPPFARRGAVLANQQFAIGTDTASTTSQLGNTPATDLQSSGFSLTGNSTNAEASANRATNSVALDGGSPHGEGAGLVNTQFSAATVRSDAITDADYAVDPLGTLNASTVTMNGNATSAMARGNAADNGMTWTGVAAPQGGSGASFAFDAAATAPIAMLNVQQNVAPVTTDIQGSSYRQPLNASALASGLSVSGNSASATAYGNQASNVITAAALGAMGAASLVNNQSNSGAVTAQASGVSFAPAVGLLSGSRLSVVGNQLNASATGNSTNSSITTPR